MLFALLAMALLSPIRAEQATPDFSLPEEELQKLRENAETFHFQAEVNRMMTLIINSLYKNKEIFLRELISNASDALDKIRFLSLTNPDALTANSDLSIKIQADEANNILHIADSGVGMTKEDLIKNLGTIAKSGTAEFMKKFEKEGDSNLIGQFGVGFYSVFLVAERVTVTTKHNDDKQYIWESTADSDFTIIEDPRGNTLGRGTVISLHLKPETADYLNQDTLRDLIKKYSEFINFPIYLWTTKTEKLEVPNDLEGDAEEGEEEEGADVEPQEGDEDEDEDEVQDVEEEEDEIIEGDEDQQEGTVRKKSKPKTKMIEETKSNFELINESKPIWLRNPSDVDEKEYRDFFKAFFKQTEDPLTQVHFRAEGEVEFRSLLFIPSKASSNLYTNEAINDIKLFVRRVFITDTEAEPLLPNYLRFIRGIVDSDDLPLNVSRETLQQSKLLKVIKKKLTKKALDMLKDLAESDKEKYENFYKEYSASLKLGIIEDASNRKRLSKLLRFFTSESPKNLTTLDDYVERFKVGQESIFFLAGSSVEEIQTSPFLERLTARGFEVLFLADPIDEYAFGSLTEFEGKKLVNAAKENLDLGDEEDEDEVEKFKPLTKWLEETLSEHIDRAILSHRLTTSPCALVALSYAWTGNMERIIKAQAYSKKDDSMTSFYLKQKKTLEINPKHPIILELFKRVDEENLDDSTKEIAKILFDTATLRSGYDLKNPVEFASRIEKVVRQNLGVDLDAQVEVNEEKLPLAKESSNEETEEDKIEEVTEESEDHDHDHSHEGHDHHHDHDEL